MTSAVPTDGPPIPPVVRTADARFENLPGHPFAPHDVEVTHPYAEAPLRMHCVDEGPVAAGPAGGDPNLTLFSDSNPATRGWEQIFVERVPGARGQTHQIQARAGHFWQEDNGAEAARIIADWIAATG